MARGVRRRWRTPLQPPIDVDRRPARSRPRRTSIVRRRAPRPCSTTGAGVPASRSPRPGDRRGRSSGRCASARRRRWPAPGATPGRGRPRTTSTRSSYRCARTSSTAVLLVALSTRASTAVDTRSGAARVLRRPGRARARPRAGDRRPRRAGRHLRPRADRPRPARPGHPAAVRHRPAAAGALASLADGPEVADRHRPGRSTPSTCTIKDIRGTIFELQRRKHGSSLRADLRKLAQEYAPALSFAPVVRTAGPVDTAVPAEVRDQLLPVLREALSNVARHARPTTASRAVRRRRSEVRLTVLDDGVGIGAGDDRERPAQRPPPRGRPGRLARAHPAAAARYVVRVAGPAALSSAQDRDRASPGRVEPHCLTQAPDVAGVEAEQDDHADRIRGCGRRGTGCSPAAARPSTSSRRAALRPTYRSACRCRASARGRARTGRP